MKIIKVPILTEEYKIVLYIGNENELIKKGSKYIEKSEDFVEEAIKNKRGIALNTLKIGKHPIIMVNIKYPIEDRTATVAHEASHAMDDIEEYLGIKDLNGEIHAHGIASVMRHFLKK